MQLLDDINFEPTSTRTFLRSGSSRYAEALALAKYLDEYNNGMYCGSGRPQIGGTER